MLPLRVQPQKLRHFPLSAHEGKRHPTFFPYIVRWHNSLP